MNPNAVLQIGAHEGLPFASGQRITLTSPRTVLDRTPPAADDSYQRIVCESARRQSHPSRYFAAALLATLNCVALSAAPPKKPPAPQPTEVKITSVPPALPSEVKIIATPEPKAESTEERKARASHEANEQGLTDYTRILANATVGLTLVAFWDEKLNPFDIKFMNYKTHVCADAECGNYVDSRFYGEISQKA